MIENLMTEFWLALLNNIDKIGIAGAFIIVTGVIVYYLVQLFTRMATVVDKMSERAEMQAQRDDVFQTRLLDLHDKSVGNNDKIVSLLDKHETAAQERADAQFIRDGQRLQTLERIAEYLTVLDKTSDIVDSIEITATRIQGNIADMQTDIPTLIERKHSETRRDIAGIKDVMSKNYELIEQALSKLKDQSEEILQRIPDDSASVELRQILETQTATLGIVQNVVTNNHRLLESMNQAAEKATDVLNPTDEENKDDDEAKQPSEGDSDTLAVVDGVASDGAGGTAAGGNTGSNSDDGSSDSSGG